MITTLLNELRARGVTVSQAGGSLKIQAPPGVVTPELRGRLSMHKQEMLRWLQDSAHREELAVPSCIPDPENRYQPFPLSDMQLGFYMADDDYLEFHVRPHYYIEKNVACLDVPRYEAAWNKALARHRGEIVVVQADGSLISVKDPAPLHCEVHDMRGASPDEVARVLQQVRAQMMRNELPLDRWPWVDLRVTLWREDGRDRARIHYNHNNFFSDGYGTTRLLQEIDTYYKDPAADLPPLKLSFRDAALALDNLARSAAGQAARNYWEQRLDAFPGPPGLPVRQEMDRRCRSRLERREGFLSAATWSAFKAQANRQGITPSNAVFAVYAEILAAWSNNRHFLLSNMMTRRLSVHPEIRDIVGNFASLYPLEVDFRENSRFVDRARNLQEQVIRDAQHLHWGGMQVMQALNRRRSSLGTAAIPFVIGSGLFMEHFERSDFSCLETSQVMLDHQFWETGDGSFYYVWDVLEEFFLEGLIDSMWEAYRRLFERLARDSSEWERQIFEVTPASALTARSAVTPRYRPVPDVTLGDFLKHTVAKSPDAVALRSVKGHLSFQELESASGRLAAGLARAADVRGKNVAIVADRGSALFKAVYAVLKAGAAYVPVDPSLPVDRRNYVLGNCEAAAVFADRKYAGTMLWPGGLPVLSIEDTETAHHGCAPFETPVRPDELAYLIYTSGSTGRPKGVMIEHKGAVNTILDVNQRFGITSDDVLFGVSSFGFDLSVYDLFGGVAAGAALVYPEPEEGLNPSHWLDEIERQRVTVWNSAPPLALLLIESAERRGSNLPNLRLVMLSGDWIPVDLPDRIRRIAPGARVVSLGGATEASIWSICYEIGEVDQAWRSIPYGYPMQNQPWYILDEWGRDVPDWTAGDLYISGDGLARGYWKDDEKTAAGFQLHPRTGERVYRTGDVGRYWPGGIIEFLGRKDSQVKIQGHRIELGEIESVLLANTSVTAAVAAVQATNAGAAQLVAYVVPTDGADLDREVLRGELSAKLPDYMVPRAICVLDRLPLTPNGKVDRKALPRIDGQPAAVRKNSSPGPADEIEQRLLALWCEVLRQSDLSVTDDFFDRGGQSFEAVRLIGAIREAFGVRMSLGSIWQERSIERLAGLIRAGKSAEPSGHPVTLRHEGGGQPLFLIHPAGGHVICYRGLAEYLDRPLFGFQAPGLDGHTEALDSISALAEIYVGGVEQQQPAGPIFLGGWSSGALISFEMAAQLRRRGRDIAGIMMIDCPAPSPGPSIADKTLLGWFLEDLALNLPVNEMLGSIDLAGAPRHHIAQVVSLLGRSGRVPGIDADELTAIYKVFLGVVKGSRCYTGDRTDADVLLIRANEGTVSEFQKHPHAVNPDWGWQEFTSGKVETTTWPGTHYTLLSNGSVEGIARTMECWMRPRELRKEGNIDVAKRVGNHCAA